MPRGRSKVWYNSSPGGIRGDLNPATIPDGEWLSSSNMLVRDGVAVPRPGYAQLGSTLAAGNRVIGIHTRISPFYVGSSYTGNVVVHTRTAAYYRAASSWDDITGTWTTSDAPVRFVTFPSGGSIYVLRTNTSNPIDAWDGSSSAFANVAAAPYGNDITVLGGYVVVCTSASYNEGVQWSALNDHTTWPASNGAFLLDAYGPMIAVRALNNRAMAVYNSSGLWLGALQAAKTAFQFSFIGNVPGPLSSAALISYRNTHYWMASDLSVWSFDGAQVRNVSPGVAYLMSSIGAPDGALQITSSAYVPRSQPELWFLVQSAPLFNTIKKLIVVNLATQAVTIHEVADYLSCIAAGHPNTNRTEFGLLYGDVDGRVYDSFSDDLTDDGTAIAWNFEYGYRPTTGNVDEKGTVDGVASYWKKTSSSCTVTVGLTVSDSISGDETEYTDTFDTSTATSNHLKTFRGKEGKWVKLKHSGTAVVADLEYRGACVTSWQRSMT
jgi:hypothetical protein